MILGIGTDLCNIDRVAGVLDRHGDRFRTRVFTETELSRAARRPHEAATLDIAHLVRNNIYAYGIRGEGKSATHRAMELMAAKRFDATRIHTHTFPLADLPTALRYARDRVDDAIKVVVTNRAADAIASAAE